MLTKVMTSFPGLVWNIYEMQYLLYVYNGILSMTGSVSHHERNHEIHQPIANKQYYSRRLQTS